MRSPRSAHLIAVAVVAVLQLPVGVVHGVSPSPPFNFSAATAASAFVGAPGNRTFISCKFDDQRAANRACNSLLGHTHGQCNQFPAYGNATLVPICTCIQYAGLTPPGNCADATCVWGEGACSVRQWQSYVAIIIDTCSLLFVTYVFGFGLYVIVVGHKNLKMNSMAVTLVFMTLSSMFLLLWRLCIFLGYAVLLSTAPAAEIQKPVAIPGMSLCFIVGTMAFPLQWLDVAKKTARIKATRGGSSKAPHIAVAVGALVISAAMIFFAVTGQTFLQSGMCPRTHLPCVACVGILGRGLVAHAFPHIHVRVRHSIIRQSYVRVLT